MKLVLRNPLIFLDIETTGINITSDRIVEISYLKVFPNGNEELKTYRVNPQMPIPANVTAIHGITNADVKDSPTFHEIAKLLVNDFEGSDFAGFNSNKFDIPILAEELLRADIDFDLKKRKFIDIQVIFHKMEQRTLGAALKFYCNKELTDAHTSKADTLATYEVLQAQLDKYEGKSFIDINGINSGPIVNDVDFLSAFSAHTRSADFVGRIIFDDKGREMFNFGKYKGMLVEDILQKDPSYYSWMMNGDFPLFTKRILTQIKLRGMIK